MTEYGTLRVPQDALDVARESKRESETWGEFIRRCSENPPAIQEFVERSSAELTRDDVKEACRAAIREELPVGELGR